MRARDYRGSVVYVVGGSMGIGLAAAKEFARRGADVMVFARRPEPLERAVREIRECRCCEGQRVDFRTLDVCAPDAVSAVMDDAVSRFGGINVLVNNAGITQRSAFMDTRVSVFKKVMEINFFGSLYCTKAALESLIDRRGMIIVLESIAGISPLLGRSGYCASKHALHGLFLRR